jgi:hypothetical protein
MKLAPAAGLLRSGQAGVLLSLQRLLKPPQVNQPPNQPLLVTPLGRPLGSDFGDPFGGRGVLGLGRD